MGNPVTIIDVKFQNTNGVGAIVPCANILKGLHTASTNGNSGFVLEVGFRYLTADGSRAFVTASIPIAQTENEGMSLDRKFVTVEAVIDPSRVTNGVKEIPVPVPGTQCIGECRIVNQGGEEVAEASLNDNLFFPGQAQTPGW
jgi:hypothetical protein